MSKSCRLLLSLALMLGLSACVGGDVASRGSEAGLTLATQGGRAAPLAGGAMMARGPFRIDAVQILVSRGLSVSEANSFYPMADIVWRGDAPGDRHAQVQAIFEAAAAQAVQPYQGGRPVTLTVEVTKFHGVTEKTRYTIGGKHNMRFDLTLRDPATGAVLFGPKKVVADVRAAGGAKAIEEDRIGRTQKVVVTERLREVIQRELGLPPMGAPMQVAMR